jgi:shikimate kinase
VSAPPAIVCLVGLRCAGKSTVGGALATRLGWPFTDLDVALVEAWNRDADEPVEDAGALLSSEGQPTFRRVEAETLAVLLAAGAPRVIATGGGCVETSACREGLRAARTIWLDAPPALLADRLRADGTLRPSLTGADPAEEMGLLAARRGPLYEDVSEAVLDATRPPGGLVEEIVDLLASRPPTGR